MAPTLPPPLRIEKPVYGGDSLAHTPEGQVVFVPFALPGELVQLQDAQCDQPAGRTALTSACVRILETAPRRTEPRCLHFGVCGGCQYQMADYPAQLAMKQQILTETLRRAGIAAWPESQVWPSPEPYGYRNRIRLRVRRAEDTLRLGYSIRGTNEFLPVTMCPIAAPLLWRAAEAVMEASTRNRDLPVWLQATTELELFCDAEETRLQLSLLCTGTPPANSNSFARAIEALKAVCPELAGAGAARIDVRSGRPLEPWATWGAAGLPYQVKGETYWITRGGFFQVNRFLIPALLDLVCEHRSGALAWDLFAGVGLFARELARNFGAVTAVEANPVAGVDLARALAKLGPQHNTVQATTLEFLRRAVVERDRPDLIVLDPPRAGAGEEVCRLLARLAPREIVYLSCDPSTLARDLAVLTASGYTLSALHLIDLFPQTYHLETLAVLHRA